MCARHQQDRDPKHGLVPAHAEPTRRQPWGRLWPPTVLATEPRQVIPRTQVLYRALRPSPLVGDTVSFPVSRCSSAAEPIDAAAEPIDAAAEPTEPEPPLRQRLARSRFRVLPRAAHAASPGRPAAPRRCRRMDFRTGVGRAQAAPRPAGRPAQLMVWAGRKP